MNFRTGHLVLIDGGSQAADVSRSGWPILAPAGNENGKQSACRFWMGNYVTLYALFLTLLTRTESRDL